eukprot:5959677-Amphidinium_carterae.1
MTSFWHGNGKGVYLPWPCIIYSTILDSRETLQECDVKPPSGTFQLISRTLISSFWGELNVGVEYRTLGTRERRVLYEQTLPPLRALARVLRLKPS